MPVVTWDDARGNDTFVIPGIGGIFIDLARSVLDWNGFNPYQEVLCYRYSVATDRWGVDQAFHNDNSLWTKEKGCIHVGQFQPSGVK